MRVVKVRQRGNVVVVVMSRAADVYCDSIGRVDELRQAVAWAAVSVIAGVMGRGPAQWDVRKSGRNKRGRKEEEEL